MSRDLESVGANPSSTDQLRALVRPFPSRFVKSNPSGGGQYVAHEIVVQRFMQVLGTAPTTRVVEVVRGDVPGIDPDPRYKDDEKASKRKRFGAPALSGAVVGVVLAMDVTVDGRAIHVEEVGDCEDPHNWPHDGARAKDAFSDAYKRCAMRVGVALHLWAQEFFYIFEALSAPSGGTTKEDTTRG